MSECEVGAMDHGSAQSECGRCIERTCGEREISVDVHCFVTGPSCPCPAEDHVVEGAGRGDLIAACRSIEENGGRARNEVPRACCHP